MSKTAKGLLIAAFCILAVWAGLSTLYTYSVSEELTLLRREGRSDTVYLRCRIRDLESELSAGLTAREPSPDEPADQEAATEPSSDREVSAEIVPDGDIPLRSPNGQESATEGVTVPTHSSPESLPAPDRETQASPAAPYLVAAREGVIGIFDATGALLRSINVYIMTLPEADREALSVGIPAEDWEEALGLLEAYE